MAERDRVKLTLQQAEQVEWALGPMSDFWCTEDGAHGRDGEIYPESDLPVLGPDSNHKTGKLRTSTKMLTLSDNDEINSDLLYRLEVQLQDMSDGEGDEGNGNGKAARNAALRIRHRRPSLKKLKHGGGWV